MSETLTPETVADFMDFVRTTAPHRVGLMAACLDDVQARAAIEEIIWFRGLQQRISQIRFTCSPAPSSTKSTWKKKSKIPRRSRRGRKKR